MEIRKNFFMERLVKPWHRLPREMVKSPPLEMFKIHVDVALEDTVVVLG